MTVDPAELFSVLDRVDRASAGTIVPRPAGHDPFDFRQLLRDRVAR